MCGWDVWDGWMAAAPISNLADLVHHILQQCAQARPHTDRQTDRQTEGGESFSLCVCV